MSVYLSPKERAHLKSRAHSLEPLVQIGNGGLTPAVITQIDRALTSHELIKVRAGAADRDVREEWLETICATTGATTVQSVGKVMILWRPNPEEPEEAS